MTASAALARFDAWLGMPVHLRCFAVLRVPAGLIAAWYLWPFVDDARAGFLYRDAFHQPYWSWLPHLPRGAYVAVLWVGLVAALAMAVGIATRLTTVATFVVVAYNQMLSTTHFHNNRAYLLAVLGVLAIAPCRGDPVAPAWPLWLLRFEAAAVYGASGTSKLLDADWFGGTVTWLRVTRNRAELAANLPEPVVSLLTDRTFQGVAAKAIIATELFIAFGLWSRRTRYAAVWVAVCFHVAIELSASVESFSYLAVAVLTIWAVPSTRDRLLVVDRRAATHRALERSVRTLDWLLRFRIEDRPGARLAVVDRDGVRLEGAAAVVLVASRLPLTAWFALPARLWPARGPVLGAPPERA
jgi:hypothetical protein